MTLFLLQRVDGAGYDEYDAKIIRANNERQARGLANTKTGDEGRIWNNDALVKCEIVSVAGEIGEILGSFNAG